MVHVVTTHYLQQPLVPVRGCVVSVLLLDLLESAHCTSLTSLPLDCRGRWSVLGHPGHFSLEHVLQLLGHGDNVMLRLVVFVAVLEYAHNIDFKLNRIIILPTHITNVRNFTL